MTTAILWRDGAPGRKPHPALPCAAACHARGARLDPPRPLAGLALVCFHPSAECYDEYAAHYPMPYGTHSITLRARTPARCRQLRLEQRAAATAAAASQRAQCTQRHAVRVASHGSSSVSMRLMASSVTPTPALWLPESAQRLRGCSGRALRRGWPGPMWGARGETTLDPCVASALRYYAAAIIISLHSLGKDKRHIIKTACRVTPRRKYWSCHSRGAPAPPRVALPSRTLSTKGSSSSCSG